MEQKKECPGESDSMAMEHSERDIELEVKDAWNRMAEANGLPVVRSLSRARLKHLHARMQEAYWRAGWREAIAMIPQSDFLLGQNDRGWQANIDFFLRASSVEKILENRYANKHGATTNQNIPALARFLNG